MEIKKIFGKLFLSLNSSLIVALIVTSSPTRAEYYFVDTRCQPQVKCVYKCRVPCHRPRPRVIRGCYDSPYRYWTEGTGEMAEYEWIDP